MMQRVVLFLVCCISCMAVNSPTSFKTPRNLRNIQDVIVNYLEPKNQPQLQVKVAETKANGFCLVAKRDFKIGEIVLLDIPVVSWCYDPKETRCSHCQKPLIEVSSLCKCSYCQEKYCSSICKKNAESYHIPLCNLRPKSSSTSEEVTHKDIEKFAMKTYAKNREDGYISLFMRLFAMAYSSGLSTPLDIPAISILESKAIIPTISMDNNSSSIKRPVNVMEKFLRSVDKLFADKLGLLYQYKKTSINNIKNQQSSDSSSPDDFLLHSLFTLQYVFQHYAVLTYKGLNGLYLSASFMNHDCEPTVEIILDADNFHPGHVMKIKALTNIKTGDEITISYIDPSMNYKNRQADLMKEYHFKCRCKRCIREDNTSGSATKKTVVATTTAINTSSVKAPTVAIPTIRSLRKPKRSPSPPS